MPNTVRTRYSLAFTVSEPGISVLTNTSGTAIVFKVTEAQGASMVIKYREFGSGDAWSESDALNTPVVDGEITISSLTVDTNYEFYPLACSESDGRGAKSGPGNWILTTTKNTSADLAPAGSITMLLENLRTLIANTTTFQAWTGTGNADAAKLRVHKTVIKGATPTRPLAGVWHGGGAWGKHKVASNAYKAEGTLSMVFESEISEAYRASGQEHNAEAEHTNQVGPILDEMLALSDVGTYLVVKNIDLSRGPGRVDESLTESQGHYYQSSYTVNWGPSL